MLTNAELMFYSQRSLVNLKVAIPPDWRQIATWTVIQKMTTLKKERKAHSSDLAGEVNSYLQRQYIRLSAHVLALSGYCIFAGQQRKELRILSFNFWNIVLYYRLSAVKAACTFCSYVRSCSEGQFWCSKGTSAIVLSIRKWNFL